MIVKEERLGGFKGLVMCPLTYELRVLPNSEGFLLAWGTNNYKICELNIDDSTIRYITSYCNSYSRYQTTPFSIESKKHNWIWYYKEIIPIFMHTSNVLIPFTQSLLFDDYGKPVMNAYLEEMIERNSFQFCNEKKLNMLVVSWNVAGLPPSNDLRDLLLRTESPDLIFFGLQEICFLGKVWGDSGREFEWVEFLFNLCKQVFVEHYTIVNNDSLVGIMSLLLIKTQLFSQVQNLQSKKVKLGLKGYTGNKGAIGTRFELLNTSICIINVHLTPHTERLLERNKAVSEVYKNLKFRSENSELCIDEHRSIFWLGDFNYRIDLPGGKIKTLILQKELKQLQKFDQLNRARQGARVLPEYHEGEINFMPTFKYEVGTNQYDFKRHPAWCDRILFKGPVRLNSYESRESVVCSDHKPVIGSFTLDTFIVDEKIKSEVLSKIYKDIDDEHHKSIPKLKFSTDTLNFGSIYYKIPAVQYLVVENSGKSNADFEIFTENWAVCEPESYQLPEGCSIKIQITVLIGFNFLKAYRMKQNSIKKFLRFCIKGGSEYLIELNFNVENTFIGQPCEYLCNHYSSIEKNGFPEFLIKILNSLLHLNLDFDDFFQVNESDNIGNLIKDIEDAEKFPGQSNSNITKAGPNELLQVFWDFLKHLPEPFLNIQVIDSFSVFIESGNTKKVIRGISSETKPENWKCLIYILNFILKILNKSSYQHNDLKLSEKLYKFIYHSELLETNKHKLRLMFLQILIKHCQSSPNI